MKPAKLSSLPTIRRLPSYLHVVEHALREGREYISGTVIAEELELEPVQVRKDLAITGIVGRPRIGFPVRELVDAISQFLHWDHDHCAVAVGAGNLSTALMGYAEFRRRGLRIAAGFDIDPAKVGTEINGKPIYHLDELAGQVARLGATIALLTVPTADAQAVTDRIVETGIRAIWNFTNERLKVPPGVLVQKEDLSSGYAVLSVKIRKLYGQ